MPDTDRRSSSKLVTIGCKLSNGLRCQVLDRSAQVALTAAGGLNSPKAFMPPPIMGEFVLKGANSLRNDFTTRGLAQPNFDYALTQVPEDLWLAWHEQNKTLDCVVRGFVFTLPKERDVAAEAKVRASELTGLEPLKEKVELDSRVNRDALIRQQRVTVDPEHLSLLRERNNRL